MTSEVDVPLKKEPEIIFNELENFASDEIIRYNKIRRKNHFNQDFLFSFSFKKRVNPGKKRCRMDSHPLQSGLHYKY